MPVRKFFASLNYRILLIVFVCWLLFAGTIDYWALDRQITAANIGDLMIRGVVVILGMCIFGMFRKNNNKASK
jgi:hypothetical protein